MAAVDLVIQVAEEIKYIKALLQEACAAAEAMKPHSETGELVPDLTKLVEKIESWKWRAGVVERS